MPATPRRPKLLIAINTSWNVVNFRAGLIRGLIAEGYDVVVAAPRDRYSDSIEATLGCRYVPLPLDGHSRSPVADTGLFARYLRLLRAERPDAFLGFTVKPNVFGSLAAAMLSIPRINNVAGLGSVFNERSVTARIVVMLYRSALRGSARVFFQNRDDLASFVEQGIVRRQQADLLPGSGIDLHRFRPIQRIIAPGSPLTFLLVARLLREKGIAELAEAAHIVRQCHPGTRVQVLGPLDTRNPAAVSAAQVDSWTASGDIEYLGVSDDVRSVIADADCVVLPSYYREGTPRALLEALAMGKPIITTDMSGCRDVVDDGENGFLVPPRDAAALATRMQAIIEAPPARREAMGHSSRLKAERQFDEAIVLQRYLVALGDALRGQRSRGRKR